MRGLITVLALVALAGCAQPGDTEKAQPSETWDLDQERRDVAECLSFQLDRPAFHNELADISVITAPGVSAAGSQGYIYAWRVRVSATADGSRVELRSLPSLITGAPQRHRRMVKQAVEKCRQNSPGKSAGVNRPAGYGSLAKWSTVKSPLRVITS